MKKVLIAEDEASIREFIVINLKRSGYDVVEAENGEEAINKYEEENGNIDVAVLDIMMPLKDGLEVCKVSADLRARYTPVRKNSSRTSFSFVAAIKWAIGKPIMRAM